jgi:hypothetical protein
MREQDEEKEQTSVPYLVEDSVMTVAVECVIEVESAGEDQHYGIGGGDALEQPEYIKE